MEFDLIGLRVYNKECSGDSRQSPNSVAWGKTGHRAELLHIAAAAAALCVSTVNLHSRGNQKEIKSECRIIAF